MLNKQRYGQINKIIQSKRKNSHVKLLS